MRFELILCLAIKIIACMEGAEVTGNSEKMWNSHLERVNRMKRAAAKFASYEESSNKDILKELNLDLDHEDEQGAHNTRIANLEDRLDTLIQTKPNVLSAFDRDGL